MDYWKHTGRNCRVFQQQQMVCSDRKIYDGVKANTVLYIRFDSFAGIWIRDSYLPYSRRYINRIKNTIQLESYSRSVKACNTAGTVNDTSRHGRLVSDYEAGNVKHST